MTPARFKIACASIALAGKTLNAPEIAIALRCKVRMVQHYRAGTWPVPPEVRDKLTYILRHGLLPEVEAAIRERRKRDGRRKRK